MVVSTKPVVNLRQFPGARVIGQALDHAVGAGGNDGSIQRVVAVAFAADFVDAPAGAQEGRHLPTEDDAAFGLAAFRQLQIALDVVLEEFADVAGVVEIAFLEFLGVLDAKLFA